VWGFVRDLHAGRTDRRRFLWLYVGTALGVLAKGLIGLLLPAAIVAGSVALLRRPSVRELNPGRGLALLAAIALPWHVAAAWRDPALFWFYLGDNQILRFLNRRAVVEDDVSMTTLAFLLVTFVWLFPWGVFLLARGTADADPAQRSARRVALVWTVVVLAFFALSRSKLEYYALPAFPAIAVGVGAAWASGRDVGRWLWVALPGALLVGAAALWVGARLTPGQALDGLAELNVYYRILREQGRPFPFESPRPLGALLQALGLLLILGWTAAVLAWTRGRRRGAFAALLALGAGIAILLTTLLALVEPHHSSRLVAEAIQGRARGADVIAHEGSLEYSAALPFYTGRRVVVVDGTRGDLELASRLPEARGWFVDGHGLARLWAGTERVFLVTQRPLRDSVASTLQPVVPLGIFGSRWLYSNKRD